MTRTSKAVVYREGAESVAVEEIQVRGPKAGEVTVRLAACGVCHSDLSATNGTIPIPPPLVLDAARVPRRRVRVVISLAALRLPSQPLGGRLRSGPP